MLGEQIGERDRLLEEDGELARQTEELEGAIREAEVNLKAAESANALKKELERQVGKMVIKIVEKEGKKEIKNALKDLKNK